MNINVSSLCGCIDIYISWIIIFLPSPSFGDISWNRFFRAWELYIAHVLSLIFLDLIFLFCWALKNEKYSGNDDRNVRPSMHCESEIWYRWPQTWLRNASARRCYRISIIMGFACELSHIYRIFRVKWKKHDIHMSHNKRNDMTFSPILRKKINIYVKRLWFLLSFFLHFILITFSTFL